MMGEQGELDARVFTKRLEQRLRICTEVERSNDFARIIRIGEGMVLARLTEDQRGRVGGIIIAAASFILIGRDTY